MTEKLERKEQISLAKNVSILDVASEMGFTLRKDKDHIYKVKDEGGLYLYTNNNVSYSHSNNETLDVIGFVSKYKGLTFNESLEYLLSMQGVYNTISRTNDKVISHSTLHKKEEPKEPLILPKKAKNNDNVIRYLRDERCIDTDIINYCIQHNNLYEDTMKNCVFVGFNEKKEPSYASLRGTYDKPFKGDVKNSNKADCFSLGNSKSPTIVACESPIEVMSYANHLKLNNKSLNDYNVISLGGVSSKALDKYLELHSEVKKVVVALNDDFLSKENAGQKGAERIINKLKDKYIVQNQTPISGDWNEDLKYYSKGFTKELLLEARKVAINAQNEEKQKSEERSR